MFITQDEIDAFLAEVGRIPKADSGYIPFYLLHEHERSRTGFIKEQYGIGGSSRVLSGPMILTQIMMEKVVSCKR